MRLVAFVVIASGCLSRYDPGLMANSLNNNVRYGNISERETYPGCGIAVPECSDVGKTFYIRNNGGDWVECIAADCASKQDSQSETDPRSGHEWMRDGNYIAELDYETAMDIGLGCNAEIAEKRMPTYRSRRHQMR